MQQGALADLPEIIQPLTATEVPFQMNLCILRKGGAKFDIYKHFVFKRHCMKLGDALAMVRGTPFLVDPRGNKKAGVKPFTYCFSDSVVSK